MIELLFMLLPIAVLYGWMMGKREANHQGKKKVANISKQYVQGLNLLLNEQSEKALDSFVELLQLDKESIDTHLAIGSVFRSRGEVHKAINIHNKLLEGDLDSDQRAVVYFQLAKDFMLAGFFDKAESIFVNLIEDDEHVKESLIQLIQLYQQTKEWNKAVRVASKLVNKYEQNNYRIATAHFFCELAEESKSLEEKINLLNSALEIHHYCSRAHIDLAKVFSARPERRIEHYKKVVEYDPNVIVYLLEDVKKCIKECNSDDYTYANFLHYALSKGAGVTIALAYVDVIAEEYGTEDAKRYLIEYLKNNPTIKGFHRLVQYYILEVNDQNSKQILTHLEKLIHFKIKQTLMYQCNKCGYKSVNLHWNCVVCKNWDSIRPATGLDGE